MNLQNMEGFNMNMISYVRNNANQLNVILDFK